MASHRPQYLDGSFADIDAMASSPLAWNVEYEQIGRGRFHGEITQLVVDRLQLGRVAWSPGVLQSGSAPTGTWMFGLPLKAERSLHIRRRPAPPGELLVATSRDDVGFASTGAVEVMVVVLPTTMIDRWLQHRRGLEKLDVDLPSPRWRVSAEEMSGRAMALRSMLQTLMHKGDDFSSERALSRVESQIFDVVFDMIPSAEVIEPLHNRARIAREVLKILHERLDDPPSVTELCVNVGARERTLHLSCLEAFGRPPSALLHELRLNAARRALLHPDSETSVTSVAAHFGFTHFGRFAEFYQRRFAELPSTTFHRARGGAI